MTTYRVTWEGIVREVYFVEAASAEDAKNSFWTVDPDVSDTLEGSVVDVEEVDE